MNGKTFTDLIDELKFTSDPFKRKTGRRTEKRINQNFTDDDLELILSIVNDDYEVEEGHTKNVNECAKILNERFEPKGFKEIGIGSNRIAYLKDGYVYKIAMDRRGCIDNLSEYMRSIEEPQYLAKVYETNRMIAVVEYARLMSYSEFSENKDVIRGMLEHLSMRYVTQDMGLISKNYCNLGFRSNGDIIFIDYAYMYKISGKEDKLVCSVCGGDIEPNDDFTGYRCCNKQCRTEYLTYEVLNMMDIYLDDVDDEEIIKVPEGDSSNFTYVKISGANVGEMSTITEEEAKSLEDTIKKRNENEEIFLANQQKGIKESSIADFEAIAPAKVKEEEPEPEPGYVANDINALSNNDIDFIKKLYENDNDESEDEE